MAYRFLLQSARLQFQRRPLSTGKSRLGGGAFDLTPKFPVDHSHANPELWYKLTFYVALPITAFAGTYIVYNEVQHLKHQKRPPHIKYEYMYRRVKPFPWGDGNHTLFHHPYWNALPEGYETPPQHGEDAHLEEKEEGPWYHY